MASPGRLVEVVAKALGIPDATVTLHDRHLLSAGLRTKGGRGSSAAKVTATDAARLLISVAASSLVKDAVATLREYGPLPSRTSEVSPETDVDRRQWSLPRFHIPELLELPADHTLEDALRAFISASESGAWNKAVDLFKKNSEYPRSLLVEVIFHGPYPQASVRIFGSSPNLQFSENHHYSNIPTEMDQIMIWSAEADREPRRDLHQTRYFTHHTINAVGDLLGGRADQ